MWIKVAKISYFKNERMILHPDIIISIVGELTLEESGIQWGSKNVRTIKQLAVLATFLLLW